MGNLEKIVEEAIAPLKAGFEADGVRVEVARVEETSITVNMRMSQSTCSECLLEEDQIEGLILDALQNKGVKVKTVQIVRITSD